MVIFHSYVSLPEGKWENLQQGMVDYWVAQSVLASPQSPSLNLSVGSCPATFGIVKMPNMKNLPNFKSNQTWINTHKYS